jgi:siroheme synthase-like protein
VTALYPVQLDLRRVRVAVVGGGAVAARKVRSLVEQGGRPVVIAPALAAELAALLRAEGLEHHPRRYRAGDLAGFGLAIAATDDAGVNAAVAREAEALGVWVNVVDDPAASTFQVPATIRQGELTLTLATGGSSPLLARRLKERLERIVTPGLGRAAGRLRAVREEVRDRWPADEARRRAFWFRLVTPEFLDCAIAGQDDEVEIRIEQCLSQS